MYNCEDQRDSDSIRENKEKNNQNRCECVVFPNPLRKSLSFAVLWTSPLSPVCSLEAGSLWAVVLGSVEFCSLSNSE